MPQNRNRLLYAFLALCTMSAGLASRRFDRLLPGLLHKNTGDALWATMVFFLLAILLARRSTRFVASAAGVFCICIELIKFVHAPGLDAVRATVFGRLVFGYVFSWSNLLCYAIGIAAAAAVDRLLVQNPVTAYARDASNG